MHLLVAALLAWNSWHTSAIVSDHGYPVFAVGGKPFFVYGASFFYERIPRDRWDASLDAYKAMGINTIDVYVIWNWHQPSAAVLPDFTGATDPKRDLLGLMRSIHRRGFKVILRPGPVIRNEWRNGGYPDWLLKRPEYNMPLRDVLEGRYPATATLQNARADKAAAEWLENRTHLRYASAWLHDVLSAVAPYSHDVIAIALDDDQGAYIDNDTYPAPHWHEYVAFLQLMVQTVAGSRVPLFLNTFEMKVTAAAPAWSWGDWYQSDAYSIGAHDLAQLDFATGLLQTQPNLPVMQAEFQAGWLQGADEGEPRPADPTNTTLALNELLRDGAHGIVNFPVQDTVYPPGWEAPWANWHYFWGAALTNELARSERYAPTANFGETLARFGSLIARTHLVPDVAIVWPPSLYRAGSLPNAAYAAFADITTAMQQQCNARGLTCQLVDLANAGDAVLSRYSRFELPVLPTTIANAPMTQTGERRVKALIARGRLISSIAGVRPVLGIPDATLMLADDETYAFVDAINPSTAPRHIRAFDVRLAQTSVRVAAFDVPARSARLVPVRASAAQAMRAVRVPSAASQGGASGAYDPELWYSSRMTMRFAMAAGARIWSLTSNDADDNFASSVGLLRDAVDPEPSPSARDFIAPYTHPLPAGTFNRTYDCGYTSVADKSAQRCLYDAPDIPDGGALFERTIRFGFTRAELVVTEHFVPHDAASTARLESVSGFAFAPGDAIVAPAGANGVGILHRGRLAMLRWLPGDVATVDVRRTRGAAIVTLVCARRSVEFHLAIAPVTAPAEADALLRANPRESP